MCLLQILFQFISTNFFLTVPCSRSWWYHVQYYWPRTEPQKYFLYLMGWEKAQTVTNTANLHISLYQSQAVLHILKVCQLLNFFHTIFTYKRKEQIWPLTVLSTITASKIWNSANFKLFCSRPNVSKMQLQQFLIHSTSCVKLHSLEWYFALSKKW